MNYDVMPNHDWSEIKHQIKSRWPRLNDTDIDAVQYNLDDLSRGLQKTYGWDEERAQNEYKDFSIAIGAHVPDVNSSSVSSAENMDYESPQAQR